MICQRYIDLITLKILLPSLFTRTPNILWTIQKRARALSHHHLSSTPKNFEVWFLSQYVALVAGAEWWSKYTSSLSICAKNEDNSDSFSLIFGQFHPHNFHSTFDDFIYFLSIGYKHCDASVIIPSKNYELGLPLRRYEQKMRLIIGPLYRKKTYLAHYYPQYILT